MQVLVAVMPSCRNLSPPQLAHGNSWKRQHTMLIKTCMDTMIYIYMLTAYTHSRLHESAASDAAPPRVTLRNVAADSRADTLTV